jgi:CubicO group peptidase (beta-lactamase class C family)
MTVRDLLVHRSGLGLGEGDLLFVPRTNLTRAESVRRLRYLKPATSFRSGFAYDNVLYMVAGDLIEAVTGQTWEQFTAEHLLKPAGMLHSTPDNLVRLATENRAQPHGRIAGEIRGLGPQSLLDERDELGRNAAPAGGLAISASDMARWMLIQLAGGRLPEGGRLFSEAAHEQMWSPVVPQAIEPVADNMKATQPLFNAYALGWEVRDYRGARVIWHHGSVLGSTAVVVLLPDRQVGFFIAINSEDGEIIDGLMYQLLDYYTTGLLQSGAATSDWPKAFVAAKQQALAEALKIYRSVHEHPAKVGPSLPLARYVGTYRDNWYGDIVVSAASGALSIDFKSTPRMVGRLEHFQYDSFLVRFEDKAIEPAYVTFNLDEGGHITHVTLKPASPLADFSYDYKDLDFRPAERAP